MTNLDKWRLMNSENPSPANFIDAGYYFIIAASLERRVWEGPERKPLFLNPYIVMVAPPGIGKSWVMDEVKGTLQKLVKPDTAIQRTPRMSSSALATDISQALMHRSSEEFEPEYVLKFSADATSYEALVRTMSQSTDYCTKPDGNIYHHASVAAIIDEFTSLLTKEGDATKDFLLTMFGCGNYKKDTIKHGLQTISHPYFTLLAGTTPERINRCKDIDIIDDGFAARTYFIYANCNRHRPPIQLKEHTPEQSAAQQEIVKHMWKLTKRYGGIELAPDAVEWLLVDKHIERVNRHPLLNNYYSRRVIHIKKMAALVELGENADATVISKLAVQQAVTMLNRWDMMMHLSFVGAGLNELAPTASRIEAAASVQELDFQTLLRMFYHDVNSKQLEVLLLDLIKQKRLTKTSNGKYTKV